MYFCSIKNKGASRPPRNGRHNLKTIKIMRAIISYRMERVVEGEDLNEIVRKWSECNPNDGQSEYVEVISVFDETCNEITNEFNKLY